MEACDTGEPAFRRGLFLLVRKDEDSESQFGENERIDREIALRTLASTRYFIDCGWT